MLKKKNKFYGNNHIPKDEYLALIQLYKEITEKIEKIKNYKTNKYLERKKINTYKYCGIISLPKDALNIQKEMRRDEWK
ncbi:MAG: hypothetical protein B6I24_10595 [Bacteroidetes bacterium 4572_128]|nr:MAG: hypothetical protein B6I24_10595 [Bacteroidetes bacterium 4572_128]